MKSRFNLTASDPAKPAGGTRADDHPRGGASTLKARSRNKAALQRQLGLESRPEALLFGVVSRLSWQKGLDLLAAIIPSFLERDAQLALLGVGDHDREQAFASAQSAHPERIGCFIGYDETLAHLVQAGAESETQYG